MIDRAQTAGESRSSVVGILDPRIANAEALERELAWLSTLVEQRLAGPPSQPLDLEAATAAAPELTPAGSTWASFVRHYEMTTAERLAILLALVPHIRPRLLDFFFSQRPGDRGRTEVGGIHGSRHGGFLPTGETLIFLLAGDDLAARFLCQHLFDRDHYFARHDLLRLEASPPEEPKLAGQLLLGEECVDLLTRGEVQKPDFSRDFPARLLRTDMCWDDLVLESHTSEQLRELEAWLRHGSALLDDWGLRRRLRPGYRCLFHGLPGTGKTLTAALLGRRLESDVYRVALSAVVSKYIGETEKNLERVFGRAESLDCLLFFDEADALFGKRTAVGDAHDRYANQEVSYLLQRIEDYAGVVILASNFSSNLDDAFKRRFQAVVHFPMPGPSLRKRLWSESFSSCSTLADDVSLDDLAERYELSGGAIMNVVRYASLMALDAGTTTIHHGDLLNGVRRELHKDGKTL